MKKLIRILIVLVVIGAGAVGVYAWLKSKGPADGGLKFVDVAKGSVTEKAVAVGQIKPRLEYHVKSKISGIVKRCAVEVGAVVQAGDPLFEIAPDPTPNELVDAERRVEASRIAFTRAESDFKRANELARQGVISRGELDAAREAYDRTQAGLARDKDALELTRKGRLEGRAEALDSVIRAPAAGVILARQVNAGDPVVPLTSYQAGTELATVADMRDLVFKGTVDEIDVGKLQAGVAARIKIGALPDATVDAHLVRIAPQAKEKDGARLFEVELDLAPAQAVTLRAGYSANADLIVREKKDVVVVPERVVTFTEGGKKATVEVPGNAPGAPPRTVEIKTGLSDGMNVEVVSGLAAGDRVVQRPPKEITGLP